MLTDTSIRGRTALVTGASGGIGKRFAEVLARSGAKVAVMARRRDRIEDVARKIVDDGGRALPVYLDVTDAVNVTAAYDETEAELGPVDIVVNAAGIGGRKALVECGESDFDEVIGTNLKGVFLVAQEAARRMVRDGRRGRIINVASILAHRLIGPYALYAASKAGVVQLSRAMAFEYAEHGIQVNVISPGYIETEMNTARFKTASGQAQIESFPRHRLGGPSVLDGVLLLLAGDGGDYITGAELTVDDGHSLKF